jgi:hypothetical protein
LFPQVLPERSPQAQNTKTEASPYLLAKPKNTVQPLDGSGGKKYTVILNEFRSEKTDFGTLKFVSGSHQIVVATLEEAQRLRAQEGIKLQEALQQNEAVQKRIGLTGTAMTVLGYAPIVGNGISLGQAIAGVDPNGNKLSAGERGTLAVQALPSIRYGKTASRSGVELIEKTGIKIYQPGETVITASGLRIDIPADYVAETAKNGKGIVYRRAGTADNANIIRIGNPDEKNPTGYIRVYNGSGQPLKENNVPGSDPETHHAL